MARIRSIKPEFFTSEQVAECSTSARLLFIGMWCFCDDNGVHPASYARLKMEVMPADAISQEGVGGLVDELIRAGLLQEYEVDGKEYWRVTGWKHQKIDRPSYKYPLPEFHVKLGDESTHAQRDLVDDSTNARRAPPPGVDVDVDVEGKGRERRKKTIIPDDFKISDRVRAWAKEKGHSRLEERFEHFVGYARRSGKVYADWDAAFECAVREDWARLNGAAPPSRNGHSSEPAVAAWSELNRAIESGRTPERWTHARTSIAIDAIGGWANVKFASSRDLEFKRPQFIAAFNAGTH